MTTNQIVAKLAKELNVSKSIIQQVINETFTEIDNQLSQDKLVMIRGYMKFVCSKRAGKRRENKLTIEDYLQLKTKEK